MKKKVVWMVALLFAAAQGAWAQTPSGNWTDEGNYSASLTKVSTDDIPGDEGTYDYYVYINSAADLAGMAYEINNGGYQDDDEDVMFKLTCDLDMSAHYWTPIGTGADIQNSEYEDHNSFRVAFDGQGHTISGITVNRPEADYNGLFGYVEFLGGGVSVIQNVVLTNCSVTGKDYTGGVVGYAIPIKMHNVYCDATVSGADKVGGLVGEVYCGEQAENPIYDCLYLGNSISATGSNKGLLFGKYTNLNADKNYYTSSSLTALNAKDVRAYTIKTSDLPSGVSVSFSGGNGVNYDGKYYVPASNTISVSATAGENQNVIDILVDGESIKSGDNYQFTVDGTKDEYVVTVLAITGTGTQDDPYQIRNETSLKSVITDGTYIKLTADIALSEKLTIASDKTVTIDLNGHKLSRSLSANENYGMVIYVNGGNLTIDDGSGDNSGSIEGGRSYNGAGILCESGSKLTVNGGTFTGNDVSRTDNGNHGRGGAIFMNPNTTLTVNGGTFDNNSAYNGGAIYVQSGATATISNATFKNCWVTGNAGAIFNNGTLTVTNCTFTSNTSTDGGAIYNETSAELTSNSSIYTSNSVSTHGGGAVTNYGTLTVNGGEFKNNSCVGNGGGIWTNQNISMSGSVTIKDNTNAPNNLYLSGSGIMINVTGALTGSEIYVCLSDYNRRITTGYKSNNSSTAADEYFHAEVDGVTPSLVGSGDYAGEIEMNIPSGKVLYVECSWTGGNTDGHVVKTQKLATSVNNYNGETEISGGWYQLLGNPMTYEDRLIISGDVKFILQDGCNVEFKKGIRSGAGSKLTIYAQGAGTGVLRATGSGQNESAAIGADENTAGGSLIIHGGNITASSSKNNAAGIGGGDGSSCGMTSITIYGGNITATGKSSGAGIGDGQENGTLPNITIYGGTVTATGGNYAAGIGGGEECSNGTIKIYGGTITATGGGISSGDTGGAAAGIGSGQDSNQDNPIYIYGGTVNATGGDYGGAGIGGGDSGNGGITNIYGGVVTAKGGKYGAGIGGGYNYNGNGGHGGTVTISGGTVTATGGSSGAGIGGGYMGSGGSVTITGGTVTVAAGDNANAIGHGNPVSNLGTNDGSLNLGGTISVKPNGGSWVDSGSRVSTVRANGTFILQPCDHSGTTYTIKDADYHTINCTYCEGGDVAHTYGEYSECGVCHLVSLADDADNSSIIAHWAGETKSIVLTGRKLYKDGNWNTLCLPFGTTLSGDLANATVKELDTKGTYAEANVNHTTGYDDGTLYLYFKDGPATLQAGQPYLVKWDNSNTYVESPVFTDVILASGTPAIVTSQDEKMSFLGNYDPVDIIGNSYLFLSTDNTLYYPNTTQTINAFRGYFQLNGITAGEPNSSDPNAVRAFSLHFGEDEEATGIGTITINREPRTDGEWYSLDGRKLSGKPTAKGVYIYKGKKRVIK